MKDFKRLMIQILLLPIMPTFAKGAETVPETAEAKALSEVAVDQYNTYMSEYRPFERKFIADVMRPTAIREAKAAGKVNADVMQKMAVTGEPNKALRDPETFATGAKIKAKAINDVTQKVKDQKVAGMQAITDMGMGKETKAQLGLEALATNATNKAISEELVNQSNDNAITRGVSGTAGAGAAIYKNLSDNYNNQPADNSSVSYGVLQGDKNPTEFGTDNWFKG